VIKSLPGPAAATLSAVLLLAVAGCGTPALAPAHADVEGTVRARVSATIGAAGRSPANPTPRPTGTPIVIGTVAPTPAAPGTPTAAGTSIATATPPGSPAASTTPAAPGTPGATAVQALALGAFARFGDTALTVARYDWSSSACPGGGGRPVPGTKYVVIRALARNDGATGVTVPGVQWSLGGRAPAAAAQPACDPGGQPFASACAGSLLAASARCEGWVLFEVPDTLDIPDALVQARAPTATLPVSWRLPQS
jgi:hypothetical protein